jgi:hypothetical protein
MTSFSSYPPHGENSDFHVASRSISDSHEPVSFDRPWRHVHPSTPGVYRYPYRGPVILVGLHRRYGEFRVLTKFFCEKSVDSYTLRHRDARLDSYIDATRIPGRSSPALTYPISPWALFNTHDSLLNVVTSDYLALTSDLTWNAWGHLSLSTFSHCERGGCSWP